MPIYKGALFSVSVIIAATIAVIGLLWPSKTTKAHTKVIPTPQVVYPLQAGRDVAAIANHIEEGKGTKVRLYVVACAREEGNRFSCLFNQTVPHYCRFTEFSYIKGVVTVYQSGFVMKKWCRRT